MIKSLERITIAAFTNKATVPFMLSVLLGYIAYLLGPDKLEHVIITLLQSNLLQYGGWMLFAITTGVSVASFRWRERIYKAELDRIQEVKKVALERQLELNLKNK